MLSLWLTVAAPLFACANAPRLACEASVLMEWKTGSVLRAENAFRRMYPASITKMMTALLALEHGRLDDGITVSPGAANEPGSSMYLQAGDVFSLESLLYGLLLNSGNDAATAIAEHVGGSVESFAAMMNARAAEIGAIGTRFSNPHGLGDPNHYSTAYDLALIARTCMRHPYFLKLVATKQKDVLGAETHTPLTLINTNRLLWTYDGADGVKTGTTQAAGECLVASAERNGMRLVAVILNAYDRWEDAARLLDWGFDNYRLSTLARAGDCLTSIPMRKGLAPTVAAICEEDLVACVPRFSLGITIDLCLPDVVDAPCQDGDIVGYASAVLHDKTVGFTRLRAGSSIGRKGILGSLARALSSLAKVCCSLGVF